MSEPNPDRATSGDRRDVTAAGDDGSAEAANPDAGEPVGRAAQDGSVPDGRGCVERQFYEIGARLPDDATLAQLVDALLDRLDAAETVEYCS